MWRDSRCGWWRFLRVQAEGARAFRPRRGQDALVPGEGLLGFLFEVWRTLAEPFPFVYRTCRIVEE